MKSPMVGILEIAVKSFYGVTRKGVELVPPGTSIEERLAKLDTCITLECRGLLMDTDLARVNRLVRDVRKARCLLADRTIERTHHRR